MLTQERLYTVDDLRAMEDQHFELIEGVLHPMTPAGFLHGHVTNRLNLRISLFVEQHKLGVLTAAETGYILHQNPEGKDTVVAPDIGFVAAARVPEKLTLSYAPFAPDLAVEVMSPGNSESEIGRKVEIYLRYGTRLVWIVYPVSKSIHVYQHGATESQATVTFLDIDATLDGGDVLPGFTTPLRDLFPSESA